MAQENSIIIQVSDDNVNWTDLATLSADSVSYAHTGLPSNTQKYYRIKAVGDGTTTEDSDFSGSISGTSNQDISYSAEAEAVFAHYTGANELSTNEKNSIARFVDSQVASGNWSLIKSFQINSGLSSASKALIDWVSGNSGTNNGASYNPSTGFSTNGTSSYINSGITITDLDVLLEDFSMHTYCIENKGTFQVGSIGTDANNQLNIIINNDGSTSLKLATDNTYSTNVTKSTKRLLGISRENAGNARFNINEDSALISGKTPEGLPNTSIYLGARNFNGAGAFGASDYGVFCISRHIGFNYASFYAYLDIMLMELGIKPLTSIYANLKPNYSNTDSLLLNSEGQSNSLFAGKGTNIRTDLNGVISGANIFWRPDFVTPLEIETLEFMVNHTYDSDVSSGIFGAGINLAKELVVNQNLALHISPYGVSGTSLGEESDADWNPNSTGELLFDSHERILGPGLDLMASTIKKIIWHWGQGEADANGLTQQQYTDAFYLLLKTKIDFYESKGLDLSVSKLHIIVPKIFKDLAGTRATKDDIIAAQTSFSVANFETAYPVYAGKISSLAVYDNDDLRHPDGIHMGSSGYDVEGYRLAEYIKSL